MNEKNNTYLLIKETIVVEGKDDESAVLASVNANIICTHGFGINKKTIELIRKAYEETGIIVFTDPDHAGQMIRERILKMCPCAKQAFLTESQAEKAGDIGIENANPDDIRAALSAASASSGSYSETYSEADLFDYGLSGLPDSSQRRAKVGAALGIGYGNVKTFTKRLNFMNVSREKLESVLLSLSAETVNDK